MTHCTETLIRRVCSARRRSSAPFGATPMLRAWKAGHLYVSTVHVGCAPYPDADTDSNVAPLREACARAGARVEVKRGHDDDGCVWWDAYRIFGRAGGFVVAKPGCLPLEIGDIQPDAMTLHMTRGGFAAWPYGCNTLVIIGTSANFALFPERPDRVFWPAPVL